MGDAIGRPCAFRYGALTLCGPVFNPVPLTHGFLQLPAGPSEPAHAIPQHPARNPRRVSHAQGLAIIRFRSPLLTEYPFLQVLRCFTSLRTPRPKPVPTHDGRWVPPFGNPRIKALLAAPRGISQPQTSFIGPVCQGIHHTPLQATHTTKVHGRKIPLANSQTTNHHTKNDHKTIETNNRVRFEINSKTKIQKPLFCSRPLSSRTADADMSMFRLVARQCSLPSGAVCRRKMRSPKESGNVSVAFRPLVPVGSTPRGASTSGLSTTCSAWGLQELEGSTECLSWSRLPA